MLDTTDTCRSTLAEALTPPEGFVFKEAIFTSYSVDLPTALSLPAQLLIVEEQARSEMLKNPVALLTGIRKLREHVTVFSQAGSIHAPRSEHLLYALLQPILCEVRAPRERGVFHPKIQLLHFENAAGKAHVRLLILSRNLTRDRSWDLSLRLEGRQGKRTKVNQPLRQLLSWLAEEPNLRPVDRKRAQRLGELLHSTHWQRPAPYESLVELRVLGLRGKGWLPVWPERRADQLVVVSPFVSESVVKDLAASSHNPAVLISRADELQKLSDDALASFESVYVLRDAALRGDGEDEGLDVLRGLHAKAYLMQAGWNVRAVVGSANATVAGLGVARNVEVLAVLEGKRGTVGFPKDLISEDGIGSLLMPFARTEPDADELARQQQLQLLDDVQREIGRLEFVATYVGDDRLKIHSLHEVELPDPAMEVYLWPVSWPEAHAHDANELLQGESLTLSFASLASVTGLLAFRVSLNGHCKRFVRVARLEGVPELQEAELIRAVLKSPAQFMAYVRFLLGDPDNGGDAFGTAPAGGADETESAAGFGTHAMLESLTRTLSRSPQRLHDVAELVNHLRSHPGSESLLPDEFLRTWRAFEAVLPPSKSGSKR